MSRVMVTGVNGFVGRHLVEALALAGHTVIGTGTTEVTTPENDGFLHRYYVADLTIESQVKSLPLDEVDSVINLAGLANVAESFEKPDLYKKVNVEVLTKICGLVLEKRLKTRILAISSGNVYDPSQRMPLTEDSKTIKQGSPYAQSKIEMENEAFKYREQGLDVVVVRPFNHFGPGQQRGFLIPDLYSKVIESRNTGTAIKVGNLKTRRDYTDVRDVVQAYIALAMTKTLNSELYNVCCGVSRSGEEILNMIAEDLGLQDRIKLEVDKDLIRPNDPAEIYGSYGLLESETGWSPKIPFEQTIRDFIKQA